MGEAKRRRALGLDTRIRVTRVLTPDTHEPMAVIRPADPEMAVRVAQIALDKQDADLFGRLPSEMDGPYTFVGILAKKEDGSFCVVDDRDCPCGELARGDSFVSLSALQAKATKVP